MIKLKIHITLDTKKEITYIDEVYKIGRNLISSYIKTIIERTCTKGLYLEPGVKITTDEKVGEIELKKTLWRSPSSIKEIEIEEIV